LGGRGTLPAKIQILKIGGFSMRHIFVINPFSGKGNQGPQAIVERITQAVNAAGLHAEIYAKPSKEGMMNFMRQAAEQSTETGEPLRVYACGGDGTLYCAVNATYGHKNVQIAAVPFGSGNDFIRLFGQKEELQIIARHINGTPVWIDAIECNGEVAINQCSMGMDAEVCAKQAGFKKLPWMTGEFAYTAALLYCLTKKFGSRFTVQIDDEDPITGDFLFAVGGNSRWYGGGYKPCPKALPDDGLLDCVLVHALFTRGQMVKLIDKYKAGEHLGWPCTLYKRAKQMKIHSDLPAAVNVDGETSYVTDATFVLKEKAVCYVVPEGSDYLEKRANGTV
jgi:diacylglycerol kinase family enzyme